MSNVSEWHQSVSLDMQEAARDAFGSVQRVCHWLTIGLGPDGTSFESLKKIVMLLTGVDYDTAQMVLGMLIMEGHLEIETKKKYEVVRRAEG